MKSTFIDGVIIYDEADGTAGISCGNYTIWNIMGYDAAYANYNIADNGDAGKNAYNHTSFPTAMG